MNCHQARNLLTLGHDAKSDGLDTHLDACLACRGYASRLATAQEMFREHHGDVLPDAGFASRVVARLPDPASEMLGWAALRLIPATLVLVLVLAWFALDTPATTVAQETVAPTDDLVSWILEQSGEQP
jgi:predicted anti-sigma-YlaC factor YlaD